MERREDSEFISIFKDKPDFQGIGDDNCLSILSAFNLKEITKEHVTSKPFNRVIIAIKNLQNKQKDLADRQSTKLFEVLKWLQPMLISFAGKPVENLEHLTICLPMNSIEEAKMGADGRMQWEKYALEQNYSFEVLNQLKQKIEGLGKHLKSFALYLDGWGFKNSMLMIDSQIHSFLSRIFTSMNNLQHLCLSLIGLENELHRAERPVIDALIKFLPVEKLETLDLDISLPVSHIEGDRTLMEQLVGVILKKGTKLQKLWLNLDNNIVTPKCLEILAEGVETLSSLDTLWFDGTSYRAQDDFSETLADAYQSTFIRVSSIEKIRTLWILVGSGYKASTKSKFRELSLHILNKCATRAYLDFNCGINLNAQEWEGSILSSYILSRAFSTVNSRRWDAVDKKYIFGKSEILDKQRNAARAGRRNRISTMALLKKQQEFQLRPQILVEILEFLTDFNGTT